MDLTWSYWFVMKGFSFKPITIDLNFSWCPIFFHWPNKVVSFHASAGTPADCSSLGVSKALFPTVPDMVIPFPLIARFGCSIFFNWAICGLFTWTHLTCEWPHKKLGFMRTQGMLFLSPMFICDCKCGLINQTTKLINVEYKHTSQCCHWWAWRIQVEIYLALPACLCIVLLIAGSQWHKYG